MDYIKTNSQTPAAMMAQKHVTMQTQNQLAKGQLGGGTQPVVQFDNNQAANDASVQQNQIHSKIIAMGGYNHCVGQSADTCANATTGGWKRKSKKSKRSKRNIPSRRRCRCKSGRCKRCKSLRKK
jgi:hypothetical protein